MYIDPQYEIPPRFASRIRVVRAVDRLLEDCEFRDLSVAKICSEAAISRATFYRDFGNAHEIVLWYGVFAAEQGIRMIGRTLNWEEAQLRSFNTWLDVKTLAKKTAKQKGYDSLPQFARRDRVECLSRTVTEHLHMELTELLVFQIDAYAYMETSMVMKWFRDGFDRSPETMARLLDSVVPRDLHDLLLVQS